MLSRNRHPNTTQNEQVYAISCLPEIAGDIISSENVKPVDGYAVLNFEVASFNRFRDIKTKSFRDGGGDDSIKRKRIRVSLNDPDSVHVNSKTA